VLVDPLVVVVGVKLTLINESKDQNKPDGAAEPPRTGKPLTIFVAVMFTSFAVGDTQSFKLAGPEFLIRPKFHM
jgi:hypothetical protein